MNAARLLLLGLLPVLWAALTLAAPAFAQPSLPPADTLLARSIAYHDPEGTFMQRTHRLVLRETRPGRPDRQTTLTFDGPGTRMALVQERDGHTIDAEVGPDACTAALDGSTSIPDSLATRYRLTCEGLRWVRDYYTFLFALPMKLTAPGTRLAPEATATTFQGEGVHALQVTFDAEVGTDTWYLYLDPDTHALVGYRFYHEGVPDEGEYVVLEGEATAAGIRLPRTRRWYTTTDDRFLGADIIEQYEVGQYEVGQP